MLCFHCPVFITSGQNVMAHEQAKLSLVTLQLPLKTTSKMSQEKFAELYKFSTFPMKAVNMKEATKTANVFPERQMHSI